MIVISMHSLSNINQHLKILVLDKLKYLLGLILTVCKKYLMLFESTDGFSFFVDNQYVEQS